MLFVKTFMFAATLAVAVLAAPPAAAGTAAPHLRARDGAAHVIGAPQAGLSARERTRPALTGESGTALTRPSCTSRDAPDVSAERRP